MHRRIYTFFDEAFNINAKDNQPSKHHGFTDLERSLEMESHYQIYKRKMSVELTDYSKVNWQGGGRA